MNQPEANKMEHCPVCNRLVLRQQAGRFLLPTDDWKTNHFANCPPLRMELEKNKKRRNYRSEAKSNSDNEITSGT